jgi:predicted peroxiredoxin
MGESTYLMRDGVSEQILGVGIAPLKELMDFVIDKGVPITV